MGYIMKDTKLRNFLIFSICCSSIIATVSAIKCYSCSKVSNAQPCPGTEENAIASNAGENVKCAAKFVDKTVVQQYTLASSECDDNNGLLGSFSSILAGALSGEKTVKCCDTDLCNKDWDTMTGSDATQNIGKITMTIFALVLSVILNVYLKI